MLARRHPHSGLHPKTALIIRDTLATRWRAVVCRNSASTWMECLPHHLPAATACLSTAMTTVAKGHHSATTGHRMVRVDLNATITATTAHSSGEIIQIMLSPLPLGPE
jgi:hypothetical protein